MSDPTQILQNAAVHHQAGRMEDAERGYLALLQIDPINAQGLRLLAGLYLQIGRMDKAIYCLERAAGIFPLDAEWLIHLGGALSHTGRLDEAAARYQQALQLRPDDLDVMNNLGLALGQRGEAHDQAGEDHLARQKLALAQEWLEKILQIDPHNLRALTNIGTVLRHQGNAEEAILRLREALRLRPDYTEAAINIALSLRDLNRPEEAIAICRQAASLQPDSISAHINCGVLLQDLRRHEDAVAHFTEALSHNPASSDARWNKALSLLSLGQYQEGWALYESGLGIIHMRGAPVAPERRWNGEDITGKRLLIWCEQGQGDNLQFIRYAALCQAHGCKVIVVCPQSLRRLFKNCTFIDELRESAEAKDFDIHVPVMSLAHIFDTTLDTVPATIPYLQVSNAARARWAEKFAGQNKVKDKLKVGLVWAGNPREKQQDAQKIDQRRSLSLEQLRDLFGIEGVQFYNLQMGAKAAQIDSCGLRNSFIDLMPDVEDFEDTAAIIEHLDLVISVDTSVAHLAGGMGKPVWVLSRFDADWRWLQNRPDNPWYPTARVFGQKERGDWAGVVEEVREELRK